MRTRFPARVLFIFFAGALLSCDDVKSGQLLDSTEPLTLLKIMVQDELPMGGRNIATDLLEKNAHVSCDDSNPCPVGNQANLPCAMKAGMSEGECPDPLDPATTPPALGTPQVYGGNSIRLVFNKILDLSIETAMPDPASSGSLLYTFEPGVVELQGPDGNAVDSVIYYDPTGSPYVSADLYLDPYGPAIVIKPRSPLSPSTKYAIAILDAAKILDKQGDPLTLDKNGNIAASYAFTTEAFYPAFIAPDFTAVTPSDVLTLSLNAAMDPATLMVVVKNGLGETMLTESFADEGSDPTQCAAALNPMQLDVMHLSATSTPSDWAVGDYTLDVVVKDASGQSALKTDAFGRSAFTGQKFTVTGTDASADADANAAANFVLPGACVPGNADMAVATDGGVQPDLAMPIGDFAIGGG